jgi:hypothetical protein
MAEFIDKSKSNSPDSPKAQTISIPTLNKVCRCRDRHSSLTNARQSHPLSILIVDDNRVNRYVLVPDKTLWKPFSEIVLVPRLVLRRVLQRLGYTLGSNDEASDGLQTVEICSVKKSVNRGSLYSVDLTTCTGMM